jgi:hypothetical protein
MRTRVSCIVLASLASSAAADDTTSIHMHRRGEAHAEPLLHLDAALPNPADAEGGINDGRSVLIDLGPRIRLGAEGKWWQSGLAPSMFAEDLPIKGWQAGAELSYDLGPFSVGINASMGRVGDTSHRMAGLVAFRTFKLSRWMTAWIVLGFAFEQFDTPGQRRQGTTAGITLGTTFR